MQVLERHAFRAKVPAAEDVGRMPANAFYAALSHGDFQAAASFTERADSMVDGFLAYFDHRHFLPLLPRQARPDARSTQSKVKTLVAVVNSPDMARRRRKRNA